MRVYYNSQSKQLSDITSIEVFPEDSKLVNRALLEAGASAERHSTLLPDVNVFLDEEFKAEVEAQRTGYVSKWKVYAAAALEVIEIDQPVTFYETDIMPAGDVYAGVMFGIGRIASRSDCSVDEMLATIEYIEDLPQTEAA